MDKLCDREFYIGKLFEKDIIFSKCGVGKVSCAISVTIMK